MRVLVLPLAGALAAAAILLAHSVPSRAAAPPAATKVTIEHFAFSPKQVAVPLGTTVTWVNKDDVPHTATSNGDPPVFNSKALDTDDSYSFTFTRPGTYAYYCKVHNHMTGKVIVK